MDGPILGGFDIKFFLLEIHMDGLILGGFDIKGCFVCIFHIHDPVLGGSY